VTLDRSSGSSLLDREALDTVRRAQPLPKVPADLPDPLTLTVAIEFALSS
jgi:protein TonB